MRVAVIGAGMAGILSAIELRAATLADVVVYEKGDGFGGTWRENTWHLETARGTRGVADVVIAATGVRAWRRDPEAVRALRASISAIFAEHFANAVVDAESPQMKVIDELCRFNLETSVADPVLRARLRPDYHAACKRLVISGDFYQAIQRPNAELVTTGIARVEPEGIRTSDGRLHPLDVLVLATGFRVDRLLRPIAVTGRDGVGAAARKTVWMTGCRSWYLDDRGIPAAGPWTFDRFREEMAVPRLEDFHLL